MCRRSESYTKKKASGANLNSWRMTTGWMGSWMSRFASICIVEEWIIKPKNCVLAASLSGAIVSLARRGKSEAAAGWCDFIESFHDHDMINTRIYEKRSLPHYQAYTSPSSPARPEGMGLQE
jgi:hypothetical protein